MEWSWVQMQSTHFLMFLFENYPLFVSIRSSRVIFFIIFLKGEIIRYISNIIWFEKMYKFNLFIFTREKKISNVMASFKSEKFNSLFDKHFLKNMCRHTCSRIFFHLKKKMKNEDVWGCSIVSSNNKMEVRRRLRDS